MDCIEFVVARKYFRDLVETIFKSIEIEQVNRSAFTTRVVFNVVYERLQVMQSALNKNDFASLGSYSIFLTRILAYR